jgi:hypothetical protein
VLLDPYYAHPTAVKKQMAAESVTSISADDVVYETNPRKPQ